MLGDIRLENFRTSESGWLVSQPSFELATCRTGNRRDNQYKRRSDNPSESLEPCHHIYSEGKIPSYVSTTSSRCTGDHCSKNFMGILLTQPWVYILVLADDCISKNRVGSSRGLLKVLCWHSTKQTKGNHKDPQDSEEPSRYSNQVPPEYKSE
jgi:hypothetical protein